MSRWSSRIQVPGALSRDLRAIRRQGAAEDRDLGASVSSLSRLEGHRMFLGRISWLFSQIKLSGGRESGRALPSVKEPGVTVGRGHLHLSVFSGPSAIEGREGRGEDCSRRGFHLHFLWSQNLILSPVADALVTSCPWGCSTVVSATSTTQGAGGLKRGET